MNQKFCNILVAWMLYLLLTWGVMNHTELWDAKLAWYSPSATHRICFYGSEHSFGTHGFRPTRHCSIVEVLATRAKFFQQSGYCSLINRAFSFWTRNVFGCIRRIMTQIELWKHKFWNLTTLLVYGRRFYITHRMKQCTVCQRTKYHNTTNLNEYLTRLELLRSRDIRVTN